MSPHASRQAGYDFLVQAMGGLMSVTGEPDGSPGAGPQKVGVALTDILTGLYTTIGALSGLSRRDRTGEEVVLQAVHLFSSLIDTDADGQVDQLQWRQSEKNQHFPKSSTVLPSSNQA